MVYRLTPLRIWSDKFLRVWASLYLPKASTSGLNAQLKLDIASLPPCRSDGYVIVGGKRLGRAWCLPFATANPGIHVHCYKHSKCSRWVSSKDVRHSRLIDLWITRQDRYTTAQDHLDHFDELVFLK